MILIILFCASFSIFLRISKNTRYRRFQVRFWCRPGGSKKRHIPYDFMFLFFSIFFKMFAKFKKTRGNGDSRTQIVAVLEVAKSDTSIRIFTFLFCFVFFKLYANFKICKVTENRRPKLLPSRRRQKATHPL